MNKKNTENKGCAGLLRNPAHPLFSDFFHRQCVSHIEDKTILSLTEETTFLSFVEWIKENL